jgi:ribose transport system permease protein
MKMNIAKLLPSTPSSSRRWIRNQRDILLIWGILLVLFVIAASASDRFLTPFNLERLPNQLAALALVAIGQTFVLLTAGIDLSVGSVVSLVGTLMVGIVTDDPLTWVLGAAIALGVGALVGLINGLAVTRLKVSPFMVTLATLSIVQGIALFVFERFKETFDGSITRAFGEIFTGTLGPIPIPLLLIVIPVLIVAVILRQTPFGRHVYALGSNENATRLSGMATDSVKLSVYVISGVMAGLAGLYTSARTLSGNPLIGETLAFESITAVVLGGVSLMGGRGSILGTLAGVLIIGILNNMLNLLRVPSDYQYVLRGVLLVLAVMLYARRGRAV